MPKKPTPQTTDVSTKKPKADFDHTITQRSARLRERVRDAGGKRITLSLDEARSNDLGYLVEKGYSPTESDAVRRAIADAAKSVRESDSAK